jgi:hypothetical protein
MKFFSKNKIVESKYKYKFKKSFLEKPIFDNILLEDMILDECLRRMYEYPYK